jgi:hypothetical protein
LLGARPAQLPIGGVLGAGFDASPTGRLIGAQPGFPGQSGFSLQDSLGLSALNNLQAALSPGSSPTWPTGLAAEQPQTDFGVLGATVDPAQMTTPSGLPGLSAPAITTHVSTGHGAGTGAQAAQPFGPIGAAVDSTHIPGLPIAASGSPQASGFQPSPLLTAANAAIASGGQAVTPSPDTSSMIIHPWSSGYVYSPTGRFDVSISDGSPPGNEIEPSGVKNPQTGEPVEATVPVIGETDFSLTNTSAPYAPFLGSQVLGNTGLFTTRPTVGSRLPSFGGDTTLFNPSGAGWYFISNRNPLYQEGADIKVRPLPDRAGMGR